MGQVLIFGTMASSLILIMISTQDVDPDPGGKLMLILADPDPKHDHVSNLLLTHPMGLVFLLFGMFKPC